MTADLLGGLPLSQLAQTLLASPHTGVDDLEEELTSPGVEDEDGPIDGLGGQVALKGFMDGHTVHIGVIHKPDDLVAEQLSIVLHKHHMRRLARTTKCSTELQTRL